MKIALDVDGVLADVIVSWINYSNLIRPDISKNQVTDWEFWKKFDIDPFDFYSELSYCLEKLAIYSYYTRKFIRYNKRSFNFWSNRYCNC